MKSTQVLGLLECNKKRIEVVVEGEKKSGKTVLINALCGISMKDAYAPTGGVECKIANVGLADGEVLFEFWEGSETHDYLSPWHNRTKSFDAALAVVNSEDKKGISSIETVVKKLITKGVPSDHIVTVVILNSSDSQAVGLSVDKLAKKTNTPVIKIDPSTPSLTLRAIAMVLAKGKTAADDVIDICDR